MQLFIEGIDILLFFLIAANWLVQLLSYTPPSLTSEFGESAELQSQLLMHMQTLQRSEAHSHLHFVASPQHKGLTPSVALTAKYVRNESDFSLVMLKLLDCIGRVFSNLRWKNYIFIWKPYFCNDIWSFVVLMYVSQKAELRKQPQRGFLPCLELGFCICWCLNQLKNLGIWLVFVQHLTAWKREELMGLDRVLDICGFLTPATGMVLFTKTKLEAIWSCR